MQSLKVPLVCVSAALIGTLGGYGLSHLPKVETKDPATPVCYEESLLVLPKGSCIIYEDETYGTCKGFTSGINENTADQVSYYVDKVKCDGNYEMHYTEIISVPRR